MKTVLRWPMKRTHTLQAVAMLAIASACARDRSDTRAVTMEVDSAGIRIITSAETEVGLARWSVNDSPTVTIGLADGDPAYQFFRIGGLTRLDSGQIVVANGGTNEVRFYSSDGLHQATAGGPGEGLGEYNGMRGLWRLEGDSILVEDALNGRMHLYVADGRLVRSWPLMELRQYVTPPPVGRFDDGRWLVQTSRSIGEPPDPIVFIGLLVAYSLDSAADTLAEVPGGPAYWEQVENYVRRLPAPFATSIHVAMSSDRVFAGNGASFEVRVLDSHGQTQALWRLDSPPRSVTAADIAADKAALLDLMRTDDQRRQLERTYNLVPMPEVMPAYSKLLVDRTGWLWVEEYYAAGDPHREYIVFSADGRPAARVLLPPEFDVRQVGDDFILGIWLDEATGVEYVRQYGLERSSAAG